MLNNKKKRLASKKTVEEDKNIECKGQRLRGQQALVIARVARLGTSRLISVKECERSARLMSVRSARVASANDCEGGERQ